MKRTTGHDASNREDIALERHVGRTLAAVERDLILATLTRCAGNRTWAADMLGISTGVLRDRLIGYARDREETSREIARREAASLPHPTDEVRPTYIPESVSVS